MAIDGVHWPELAQLRPPRGKPQRDSAGDFWGSVSLHTADDHIRAFVGWNDAYQHWFAEYLSDLAASDAGWVGEKTHRTEDDGRRRPRRDDDDRRRERWDPSDHRRGRRCGLLSDDAVELLAAGVRNALRHLGMLPGEPERPARPQRRVGRFDWFRCERAGWWVPSVRVGDEVAHGAPLGEIRDLWGDVHQEISAPADGVVLFLTTSPAVSDDGLLLGLGAALTPVVG
jgi:hypothetical protein